MVYTPLKTITINNMALTESFNLTRPLSDFLLTNSYLVVANDNSQTVLSLALILLLEKNLTLNTPVATALSALLTDQFVARYTAPNVPATNQSGYYNNTMAVFNPISYKSFKTQFVSVQNPSVRDDIIHKGFLDDLVISDPSGYDLSNCLVAVNGVFHKTTILNNELFVLDGFRTMRLTGRKDVTLVDTHKIGGHTIVPLTSANVSHGAYQDQAIVTLTQPLLDKTVFVVIDGYFYHQDTRVTTIADPFHVKIKLNKLPLIEQFRHNPRTIYQQDILGTDAVQSSRKYSDAYDALFLNNAFIPSATFQNAAFQYSRLTHYHSFLVIVNNPSLYSVTTNLIPTGTPQYYEDPSNKTASGMMSYGCGLSPSYLIYKDPYDRKSIFIENQDYDVNRYTASFNPAFVPTLNSEVDMASALPARCIDYVSA